LDKSIPPPPTFFFHSSNFNPQLFSFFFFGRPKKLYGRSDLEAVAFPFFVFNLSFSLLTDSPTGANCVSPIGIYRFLPNQFHFSIKCLIPTPSLKNLVLDNLLLLSPFLFFLGGDHPLLIVRNALRRRCIIGVEKIPIALPSTQSCNVQITKLSLGQSPCAYEPIDTSWMLTLWLEGGDCGYIVLWGLQFISEVTTRAESPAPGWKVSIPLPDRSLLGPPRTSC